MRRRVEETLDLLGIADLRDRDLRTLSGGQQQRVAIGSVLTMHPRLLVLDEPTSALDPTAAEDVLATLTRLVHDLGVSVLLAEHRLERVVPFADRIVPARPATVGSRVGRARPRCSTTPRSRPPIVELGRAGRLVAAAAERARRPPSRGPALRWCWRRAGPAAGPAPRGACSSRADGGSRWPTAAQARRCGRSTSTLARRPGHRADGPQRVGQVDADVGAAGARTRAARARCAVGRRRTRRRWPADARRRSSGLVPQTAADLLYLETVAEECAAADAEAGGARPARAAPLLDRLAPGIDPDDAPARPLRGAAAGPGARDRAHRRARRCCCLDEPTRGLDYPARRRSPRSCADAGRRRVTPCSWRPTTWSSWPQVADRVVVLAEGEVVSDGPDRARRGGVAGVRPAGHQDPRRRRG